MAEKYYRQKRLYRGAANPNWKGGKVKCVCQYCGFVFHIKKSKLIRGEGKYCSLYCKSNDRNRTKLCALCGQEFIVPKSHFNRKKYCSIECGLKGRYPDHNKNNCVCVECGISFRTKSSALKRKDKKGVGKFCSMDCKAKHMSHNVNPKRYVKGGKRTDLKGVYFRSSWEANYARYLNWLISIGEIVAWEFEPDVFEFPVKKGSKYYTPDFKIFNNNGSIEYHEVKGWMNSASKTKLKRMKKYYPETYLIVIDSDAYRALAHDVRGFIENWE